MNRVFLAAGLAGVLFAADLNAQAPGFRVRAQWEDDATEWRWVQVPTTRRRVMFVGEYLLPDRQPRPMPWGWEQDSRKRVRVRASYQGRPALLPWNAGRTQLQWDYDDFRGGRPTYGGAGAGIIYPSRGSFAGGGSRGGVP